MQITTMDFLRSIDTNESGLSKKFVQHITTNCLPGIVVNTVVFSYYEEQLKVLLLRFSDTDRFMLPGGFIGKEEELDEAAKRTLMERSSLENIHLKQFYTTGNNTIDYQRISDLFEEKLGKELSEFFDQRFIRVCYYALIDESKVHPATKDLSVKEYQWVNIQHLPKKLLFNHNNIVDKAYESLKDRLDKDLVEVGSNLMNETFTMMELKQLYEVIFQTEFVRSNFQRKILSMNILDRLEKQFNGKSHKAPFLYKFKVSDKIK